MTWHKDLKITFDNTKAVPEIQMSFEMDIPDTTNYYDLFIKIDVGGVNFKDFGANADMRIQNTHAVGALHAEDHTFFYNIITVGGKQLKGTYRIEIKGVGDDGVTDTAIVTYAYDPDHVGDLSYVVKDLVVVPQWTCELNCNQQKINVSDQFVGVNKKVHIKYPSLNGVSEHADEDKTTLPFDITPALLNAAYEFEISGVVVFDNTAIEERYNAYDKKVINTTECDGGALCEISECVLKQIDCGLSDNGGCSSTKLSRLTTLLTAYNIAKNCDATKASEYFAQIRELTGCGCETCEIKTKTW